MVWIKIRTDALSVLIWVQTVWKGYQQMTKVARRVARWRPGSLDFNIIWASMRETLTLLLANNKGADQPVHPGSLISIFVYCYLKSKATKSDISSFSSFVGFNIIKTLAMPRVAISQERVKVNSTWVKVQNFQNPELLKFIC